MSRAFPQWNLAVNLLHCQPFETLGGFAGELQKLQEVTLKKNHNDKFSPSDVCTSITVQNTKSSKT